MGDPGNSYSILIGNNLDFDRMYSFEVNTEYQDFSLFYFDGMNWHTIVPWTVSLYINPGMASNNLEITRYGSQITLEFMTMSWAHGWMEISSVKPIQLSWLTHIVAHQLRMRGLTILL